MDAVWAEAFRQDRSGWPGIRIILMEWLLYAANREARTELRIHRSPQLRRILTNFMLNEEVLFQSFY